jgi:hypothetical protein
MANRLCTSWQDVATGRIALHMALLSTTWTQS